MRRGDEPILLRHSQGSALEHALLGAGASSPATATTHAKTLAALGLAAPAALIGATAAAAQAAKVATAAWTKLAVAASLVGAVTVASVGYVVVRGARTAAAPERPAAASAHVAPPAPIAPTPKADDEPPMARDDAAEVTAATAVVPAKHRHRSLTDRRGNVRLSRELAALDAVRGTLARGDARNALTLLDLYAQAFPHGRLALEAAVLRIDALGRLGQRDAARECADTFLRRHPQSVLASRVRAEAHPNGQPWGPSEGL